MVGSLFSKRPRVTGSNCKTSCFTWTIFSFGGFASFSMTGFFFGGSKRGAGMLIDGDGTGGGGASAATGGSTAIKSSGAGSGKAALSISGTMSIFGGAGGGSSTCSKIAGGGARNGSGGGDVSWVAIESSEASELMIVTLSRFPISHQLRSQKQF